MGQHRAAEGERESKERDNEIQNQCDQMAIMFVDYCVIKTVKLCPIKYNFARAGLNYCQRVFWYCQSAEILPKAGHTA